MSRIITLEECAKHSDAKDLWVIVHDNVFDVTQWSLEHPGGNEIMIQFSKENADAKMEFEEIKHSQEARDQMMAFKIGTIQGASNPRIPLEGEFILPNAPKMVDPPKSNDLTVLIGAAVVAIGGYFLYKTYSK